MPDLDFAKVMQRLGLTVGDGADPDETPDTTWCDGGTVQIVPLNPYVKVADGSPVPWTGGNAVIECTVTGSDFVDPTVEGEDRTGAHDGAGYLLYNGKPYVWVVDLASDKVNPTVETGATHRINYVGITAAGTAVTFPSVNVRITAAGDGISPDGFNDLTILSPVNPGDPVPIVQGPPGPPGDPGPTGDVTPEALAAQAAAETAQAGAEAARDEAETAAATATTKAGEATTAASTATTKASEATTAAGVATTKAGEAADSATATSEDRTAVEELVGAAEALAVTNDTILTAIDADPDSDFRQQSDARHTASYEAKVDRTSATTGQVPTLQVDGTLAFETVSGGGGGTGDVTGPASSTDSRIAAFDGTTGKLLKDGGATIAQVRDRSTHTGTQSADTITDGATNKAYTATEQTKLAGVATGATANATDAQLRDRSTHTGTQALSTISDAGNAASKNVGTTAGTVAAGDDTRITGALQTSAAPELIRDTMGTALVAGTNVTITPDDAGDTITIAASGGGDTVYRAGKTADTARTSTATLANDPHLTVTLPATAGLSHYRFKAVFRLLAGASATPDFKWNITVPGGTIGGTIFGSADAADAARTTATAALASGTVALPASAGGWAFLDGILVDVPAGGGAVTVQWAQNVSDAAAITLRAGSYIELVKVAG